MKKFELPRTPAQWLEAVMNAIFFLCGILAVGCVAVITIYMFLSGLPAIGKIGPLKFLFGTEWASTASEPKYGILPFLLSSIYGTLGASLIGVIQDSVETALNSAGDVEFAATAEYHQWLKQGKLLPAFLRK